MNISDNMAITEFLQEHGYQPTSVKGNNWWYLSPLRNELTASFKVDVNKNVWYDFGLGKGGNLRTLEKLLLYDNNKWQSSNHVIEPKFPVIQNLQPNKKADEAFTNVTVMELTNHSLLYYLKGRGVSASVATCYCKEILYTNHGKRFMLLALPIAAEGMRYAMLISRDASLLRTYLLLSMVMMIVMYLKASLISYLM